MIVLKYQQAQKREMIVQINVKTWVNVYVIVLEMLIFSYNFKIKERLAIKVFRRILTQYQYNY
ncbi:unnamed protein product [Paramecium sonneborni]|uniref:Uncharacterized protein n=1 Tax=Paramecium sonneborni TaxID=65129 RepID=A0A8S1KQA4_9CILI|nr:unnamed protein product [Paramecium sonneborni]